MSSASGTKPGGGRLRQAARLVLCWAIGHRTYRSDAFEQTCTRCRRAWWADYFQWRQDGYPTWHRVDHLPNKGKP